MAPADPTADRVAVVTGASGGIGRAVVSDLAASGYSVAMTYRTNPDAVAAIARSLASSNVMSLHLDVANADEVEKAFRHVAEKFGGIDLVVHAAGARVKWLHVADLAIDDWDSYIEADLHGAFYVVRAALPHIRARGGGQIILLSSIAAQMCQPRNVQGAVAKAGVEALMRVAAREEARHNIRLNAVSVGLTDTAMGQDALARWGAERGEKVVKAIPLGRMGTPQEVARLIGYLASDHGAYITGKVLQIDGGQFIAG
jgi:3-oxoacyl-[acyl-carrier protein] reductase